MCCCCCWCCFFVRGSMEVDARFLLPVLILWNLELLRMCHALLLFASQTVRKDMNTFLAACCFWLASESGNYHSSSILHIQTWKLNLLALSTSLLPAKFFSFPRTIWDMSVLNGIQHKTRPNSSEKQCNMYDIQSSPVLSLDPIEKSIAGIRRSSSS